MGIAVLRIDADFGKSDAVKTEQTSRGAEPDIPIACLKDCIHSVYGEVHSGMSKRCAHTE